MSRSTLRSEPSVLPSGVRRRLCAFAVVLIASASGVPWAAAQAGPPLDPAGDEAAPKPEEPGPSDAPPSAVEQPPPVPESQGQGPVTSAPREPVVPDAPPTQLFLEGRPPDREPRREEVWYGWQTLAVDGAGIIMLAFGAAFDNEPALGIGTATMFVGSPVVHFTHGAVGRGFGSLGLRLGAVAVTTIGAVLCVGNLFDSSDGHEGGCVVMVLGLILMPGAIVIDAAALARETVEVTGDDAAFNITPFYDSRRRAAGVSWRGRF